MPHLILLGDSIFDNAPYVTAGPPVIAQLQRLLRAPWHATLLAVDGHTTQGAIQQLARLPQDATHLIISAGGNDALQESEILTHNTLSVARALEQMQPLRDRFRARYRAMLAALTAARLPAAVCTIYNAIPGLPLGESAALGMINEIILQEAFQLHLPVLDLRLVCTEPADYSTLSPIEPSTKGGLKIAQAIATLFTTHDFTTPRSIIYQ